MGNEQTHIRRISAHDTNTARWRAFCTNSLLTMANVEDLSLLAVPTVVPDLDDDGGNSTLRVVVSWYCCVFLRICCTRLRIASISSNSRDVIVNSGTLGFFFACGWNLGDFGTVSRPLCLATRANWRLFFSILRASAFTFASPDNRFVVLRAMDDRVGRSIRAEASIDLTFAIRGGGKLRCTPSPVSSEIHDVRSGILCLCCLSGSSSSNNNTINTHTDGDVQYAASC